MPTYKGVEVWIEDSEHRRLSDQEVSINLVDDRTVTVKTEMSKDEFYSIHCLSPISVFCDVFVITACDSRKLAARFHIDKTLAICNNASGSSVNHMEGRFRDRGLRTPKRQQKHGRLCSAEVEIRRIGGIIKGEPLDECENGDEQDAVEFSMVDDFHQPPWLIFRFEFRAKKLLAALAPPAEHIGRRVLHRSVKDQRQAASGSRPDDSGTGGLNGGTSRRAGYERLHNSRKHTKDNGCGDLMSVSSDQLHEEYRQEEAEERRLLQKLEERLQTKKARNVELRRLLGEAP